MMKRATAMANKPNPLALFLTPAPVKTGAAGNVGTVALAGVPDNGEAELIAMLDPYEALLGPAD